MTFNLKFYFCDRLREGGPFYDFNCVNNIMQQTNHTVNICGCLNILLCVNQFSNGKYEVGVDRYVFFRADTDTDYYRSSRPINDILNQYMCFWCKNEN